MNKVLAAAVLALSVGTSSFAYAQTAQVKPADQAQTTGASAEGTMKPAEQSGTQPAAAGTDQAVKPVEGTTDQAAGTAPMSDEKQAGTAESIDKENGETTPVTETAAEKPAQPAAEGTQAPATAEAPAAGATEQPTTTVQTDNGTVVTTTDTAATTEGTAPAADGTAPVQMSKFEKPSMAIENFQDIAAADISSDELVGTTVYDTQENNIGEVGDLVLSSNGTSIEQIVLDVGGFLGIGEHHVAVAPDSLQILRDEGGNMRIYVSATEDQLKAEPSYVKPEAMAPATEETAPATQPTE